MASLYTKVKKYLEANSKTESEFDTNIILQNDSSGDYIHTWNVSGLAKPSDDQIASYNSTATTEENNVGIKRTRRKAYGDIGDQLDLLYKDMLADKGDKSGEWFKSIKAVKDANPKE